MENQIKFIQLLQSEYDNISPKNTGSLYFTTDTHRIYKGEDLYASTTFDSLKFDDLNATSIKVDGKDVSLEGHVHSKDDISDFPTNVSSFTNDAGYLKSSELDLSGYMPITGATLNSNFILKSSILPNNYIEWDNRLGYFGVYGGDGGFVFHDGTRNVFDAGSWIEFDNWGQIKTTSQTLEQFIKSLITSTSHNHTISQITDFPTNVSSFTNDAGYLTETDLYDIEFGDLEAQTLKVDGKDVSVEGHTHTKSDISDFPTNVSSFTNDAGYITQSNVASTYATKTYVDDAIGNVLTQEEF